jgi:hypothetical protein
MAWMLAQTVPNFEMKASERLSRFGFQNRLFKHQISCVNHGRVVSRLVPAFPRYLFVFVADEMLFFLQLLWDFFHLSSFIRSPFVERAMDWLLRCSMPGDVLPVDHEQGVRFKFGDRVQIVSGRHIAFGCNGIYQHTVRPGRVCILSPWLGQMVPIEVNESDIELVLYKKEKRRRRRHRKFRRRSFNDAAVPAPA